MKTTSTIVSSLVLILSLTACGGAEDSSNSSACTQTQLSAWTDCQSNGLRTRAIVAGDCPVTESLVEACSFHYCDPVAETTCLMADASMMCCPTTAPHYCPTLARCFADAMDAAYTCGSSFRTCRF
jgi:hypothetical protein